MTTPQAARLLLTGTLAWLISQPAPGGAFQQTQQAPVFRSRADLVRLDVSVLDRDRRPIRGIPADRFTVSENGKPQVVSLFEAVDVPGRVVPDAPWMRDVTPDVSDNGRPANRLWLIVVDDALIQGPSPIRASKAIVREIVSRLGPHDLASVTFTTDSRGAQDFTNDHTSLLATLDNYNPGWTGLTSDVFSGMSRVANPDWQFQLGALRTVYYIVEAMIAAPHTRKALVWITPGVPLGLTYSMQKAPSGFSGDSRTMAPQIMQLQARDVINDIFDLAGRGHVPIYPIDTSGCCPGGDWHLTFASNTGGRAVVNTNDFTPGIAEIFEENASYYLIGYHPANTQPDGSFRRIDVTVDHPDVDIVRTRTSYDAPRPDEAERQARLPPLSRALADPLPGAELPLRATAAPFALPGHDRMSAVAIVVGVTQPGLEASAATRVTVMTGLHVIAVNTEGKIVGEDRSSARVTLRAGAEGNAEYEAMSRLELPPGRYRLRIAADHEASGKVGTVMTDVVVPDFERLAASMSGAVLTAFPGRPSAPRNLFFDVLPLTPTAQRTFNHQERVLASFFVYQTGPQSPSAASATLKVVNETNDLVLTDSISVDAARFRSMHSSGLRAADVQYELPIARLTPGRYLLTIEVMVLEQRLQRHVMFSLE